MGRYYYGDIEGKFAVCVQSSYAPERFGAKEDQSVISWFVNDLNDIMFGIKDCLRKLKGYRKKIDKYFENRNYYSDEKMSKELGVSEEKLRSMLTDYFDLKLGIQMYKCVKEQGDCCFEGEM